MLTVKVHSADLINSLTKLEEEFKRTTENAVYQASAKLVDKIIGDTLGPPPGPPPTMYKRTFRLVNGWGEAARALDLPLLGSEESEANDSFANLNFSEHSATFQAQNRVPYAWDVENEGTWQAPLGPHANPPNFRPGYFIVLRNKEETKKKFPQYVHEAWTIAKNAA